MPSKVLGLYKPMKLLTAEILIFHVQKWDRDGVIVASYPIINGTSVVMMVPKPASWPLCTLATVDRTVDQ